ATKVRNRYAHGYACIARLTLWAIDQIPATPEAEPHEASVLIAVELVARIEEQHRCGAVRQIAARMRHRLKYLWHFQSPCHDSLKRSLLPYLSSERPSRTIFRGAKYEIEHRFSEFPRYRVSVARFNPHAGQSGRCTAADSAHGCERSIALLHCPGQT